MQRLDTSATNQIIRVGEIEAQLELGQRWTIDTVTTLLKNAPEGTDARIEYLAYQLIGTPFAFESNLPILPDGRMRVRLSSFDCITFIYTILALFRSNSFEEFVWNLYLIRYRIEPGPLRIENDPDTGNIFDFACESLLVNAAQRQFVRNVTEEIAGGVGLERIAVVIERFRRPVGHDRGRQFVTPKLGYAEASGLFIPAPRIGDIDVSAVQSGDLAVLTRGRIGRDGSVQPVLVGHVVIAIREGADVYFVHSTRHFSWHSDTAGLRPPQYTQFYYDGAGGRAEQIGVGHGGRFSGDENTLVIDGEKYYAMDQSQKRTLGDYVRASFAGVAFLRPLRPSGG